ncbi:tigger transposable element-derived protein 6-like protein [Plakobranchus ocellatus]|uniref:Tigger transposable element-derived protein 6-like protein n=1 Tax=Plakobranchus ocellatus TaxID=259542 RepID=A0AAV4DYM6_9GAST|nr:tigger transposable element-derived protein 6-like protein [Plakobranchus ocellatus]
MRLSSTGHLLFRIGMCFEANLLTLLYALLSDLTWVPEKNNLPNKQEQVFEEVLSCFLFLTSSGHQTWPKCLKTDLPRSVVLFCDGHTSHVNLQVHEICNLNEITYYLLPAHASHISSLSIWFFYGNLKREWRDAVAYHRNINKVAAITKRTFMPLFRDVWERGYDKEHLKTAFRKSGLCPWDPEAPDYSKCHASLFYGKNRTSGEENKYNTF